MEEESTNITSINILYCFQNLYIDRNMYNYSDLTFADASVVADPLSIRRTSRYNPHTMRTVQCDFHENPNDGLVAEFIHGINPTA